MRVLTTFLLIVFVLLVCVYAGVFIFVNTQGKEALIENLESRFSEKVNVEAVTLEFPFTLTIKNFSCGDVVFKRLSIPLVGGNFLLPRVVVGRILVDGLQIKIKREKDKISLPVPVSDAPVASSQNQQVKTLSFNIKNIQIQNASIEINDVTQEKPITIKIYDINAYLGDVQYPRLSKLLLDLKASVEVHDIKMIDALKANGWVDYAARDMDVDCSLQGVAYTALRGYYAPMWSAEKLGIHQATISLKTNITSVKNDCTIQGIVYIDKVEYLPDGQGTKQSYVKTILALIQGKDDKPEYRFSLKTKMDSPNLDFSSLTKNFKGIVKFDVGSAVGQILDQVKEGTMPKQLENIQGEGSEENNATAVSENMTVNDRADTSEDIGKQEEESFKQSVTPQEAANTTIENVTANVTSDK